MLAILQQIPIFCDYIINGKFKEILVKNLDNDIDNIKDSVIYNLYRVFKISLENDNKNITPTSFRKVISKKDYIWGEHQHQDSQEFLTFLLSNIENEIKTKVDFIPGSLFKNDNTNNSFDYNSEQLIAIISWQESIKKEFSLIKMLFTGQFQKINECSICKNRSNNFETYESISLSIPIKNKGDDLIKTFDLKECFDYYFKKEKLDKQNKLECNFCYLKNQSNIYNKLWKTPKILIIQIKRFLTNDYGIPTQKLVNKIKFPINNLDISDYINPNSPDINKCKYNLLGVNYHYSLGSTFSCSFGHYVSIVKNRFDNNWYEFDDNRLKKIEYQDEIVNKNAYLLFYYRTN
jgi:ubiquitin C-terminal hydrolase